MNYSKNKKYFKTFSIKTIIIIAVIGLLALSIKAILGIIILAVAGGLAYMQLAGRPTDSEIDEQCEQEVATAKKKALDKLGLDEDQVKIIEPILIEGPCFEKISLPIKVKKGKDSRWRSSNYEAIYLMFSDKQVYAYTYRFSIIENERNESTDEYFYKDIVSVATSSDTIDVEKVLGSEFIKYRSQFKKEKTINHEQFKLTTSGGTSITCSVWDLGAVQKSIQGMKQLLREKKNA